MGHSACPAGHGRMCRRGAAAPPALQCASMPPQDSESDAVMRASYVKVIVVWILTLAAIYALQQSFA